MELSPSAPMQPNFEQIVPERAPQSNRWPKIGRELARMIKTVTEGPLYDRKRQLPYIRCATKDVPKLKPPKEDSLSHALQSLVIDAISMLNSARRRGVPTYIVFGVDNDWKPNRNLVQQSAKEYLGIEADADIFDHVHLIEQLLGEIISREMHKHADCLIFEKPLDAFELEYGWLQIDYEQYFLCCIEFEPTPTEKPFMVAPIVSKGDAIWLEKLDLTRGQVHSRVGESNKEFRGSEIDRLVCWREIPFISLADVDKYCRATKSKLAKQGNDLYPDPAGLGKQHLYVKHEGITEPIEGVLSQYIRSADNSSSTIILVGGGGLERPRCCAIWRSIYYNEPKRLQL